MATKEQWEQYRDSLRDQIADERAFLEPLKGGTMWIGTRYANGEWVDITADHISRGEETIATLQAVLDKIEEDHLS